MTTYKIEKIKMLPEQKLMTLLTIGQMNDHQEQEARCLNEQVDWRRFAGFVNRHRVNGLVVYNGQRLGLVNEANCSKLIAVTQTQTFDAMKQVGGLIQIQKTFRENNIPMLLLKGPTLSTRFYSNPVLRISHDLDILVSKKNWEKAEDVLHQFGFWEKYHPTPKQRAVIEKNAHHEIFYHTDGRMIELHWRLDETMNFDLEQLWPDRQCINVNGQVIDALEKNMEALFLIHHGMRHGYYRLKWLLDIMELMKRKETDWSHIFQLAIEYKFLNEVYASIILCYMIGEFDLQEKSFSTLFIKERDGSIVVQLDETAKQFHTQIESAMRLLEKISPLLLMEEEPTLSKEFEAYYKIFVTEYIQMTEKSTKKVRSILKKFIPGENEFQKFPLNDRYFFMYYIIRPVYKLYRIIVKTDDIEKQKE